jgi:hypothetical protein
MALQPVPSLIQYFLRIVYCVGDIVGLITNQIQISIHLDLNLNTDLVNAIYLIAHVCIFVPGVFASIY